MKRQRGRGRKPGGNQGNRPLESNGPDVKIRGTAAQIYEKYAQYARDAQSSGDRVKYENYMQHAEHYFRIMMATMPRDRFPPSADAAGEDRDGEDPSAEAMRGGDFHDEEGEGPGEDAESAEGEERVFSEDAEPGQGQDRQDGFGRSRRRRHRRRHHESQEAGDRAPPGDSEARSALDMLAQRQAASLGGG